MSHLSLQMLTWGTIAGAVASAVLLASSEGSGELRFDMPAGGQRIEQRLQRLHCDLARDPLRAQQSAGSAPAAADH